PIAVPPPRRWPARVLAGASAAALIAVWLSRLVSSGPPPVGAAAGPAGHLPAQTTTPVPAVRPTGKPTPAIPQGVQAMLDITAPCWVQATADGRVVVFQTLPAGRSVRLHAKNTLILVIGNAGGVRLVVN